MNDDPVKWVNDALDQLKPPEKSEKKVHIWIFFKDGSVAEHYADKVNIRLEAVDIEEDGKILGYPMLNVRSYTIND